MKPRGIKSQRKELYRSGRHLFYSEGTKTEPYFVNSIESSINYIYSKSNKGLCFANCNPKSSLSTLNLAKYAIDDATSRKLRGEQIDHVWIFFDKDDFSTSDYNSAIKKINAMNNSKHLNGENFKFNEKTEIVFHALPSNEAFELFLLLYFNLIENRMSRSDYSKKLEEYVRKKGIIINFKYQKNLGNIHEILTNSGGSIKRAIKNAKIINKGSKYGCPSTRVCDFAEYILPYLDSNRI